MDASNGGSKAESIVCRIECHTKSIEGNTCYATMPSVRRTQPLETWLPLLHVVGSFYEERSLLVMLCQFIVIAPLL